MFQNMTPKQKDILKALAIVVVAVVAIVAYLDFGQWRKQINDLKQQSNKIGNEIKTMETRIREIDVALANVDELRRKQELLAQISAKLPDSPDAPGFYNALVKILQSTRINYTALEPKPPAERTAYMEIPYSITCAGRYHDFGQFLNLIEENPDRFMRVKSFSIDNSDKRPSIHPITVDIATFMFLRR
jgi:Tfp pilus assembly protein PilO